MGQASTAIFAASGAARHRLTRAAVAAAVALLAAWLIALALGVLGGFGSLPGLPNSHPAASNEVTSHARAPAAPVPKRAHAVAGHVVKVTPARSLGASTAKPRPGSSSSTKPKAPQQVQSTSGTVSATSTTHRKSDTQTTGKPVGSPGNGPGGSGAPGQLRR